MTNIKLDRRSLVAVAGAGMLAACSKSKQSGPLNFNGRPEPYGLDPNIPNMPNGLPAGLPSFSPNWITLVRVSSSKAWEFEINHASFASNGMNADARKDTAIAIFRKTLNGHQRWRFSSPNLNPLPASIYKRQTTYPGEIDVPSFDKLGANQPTEIFVWYDDPRAELYADYFISFTPFNSEGKPTKPNDSFFAARVTQPLLPGPLVRIRNYFCDYDDPTHKFTPRAPGSTERLYSLNLHVKVPGSGGKTIPLIIDPDTGNGSGWEP